MTHLREYALLTLTTVVPFVLALCFLVHPAHAQAVTAERGGAGEHLLFAYWSTAAGTNTHVNIHSPLGVRAVGPEDKNVVAGRVRSTAPDRNVVLAFTTCLLPGDSWTAMLSAAGLQVVDAGGCDADLREPPPRRNTTIRMVATPLPGEPIPLGDTAQGYLEAWLTPTHTLNDDTVGEPDVDFAPEHATPRPISGLAMLVSPRAGFSSSYNATALRGCGATAGIAIAAATDDGDGCWAIGTGGSSGTSPVAGTADGVWIRQALRGVTTPPTAADPEPAPAPTDTPHDLLLGRWTAIADENVTSTTTLVLTFPVHHLTLDDGSADPVSVHVYDESGKMLLQSVGVHLTKGVNRCAFLPPLEDRTAGLVCSEEEVGALAAPAGAFRLFNNTAVAPDETTAQTRERPGLGSEPGGAQDPAESLAALGLIFSYFAGTDGLQYDQASPIQWSAIADDASTL